MRNLVIIRRPHEETLRVYFFDLNAFHFVLEELQLQVEVGSRFKTDLRSHYSPRQVKIMYEPYDPQLQELAPKKKRKRKKSRSEHTQQVPVVPDVDSVDNQPKNAISHSPHEDKSKKRSKKKKKKKKRENVTDCEGEEGLDLDRRKLIEAALANHETAKGSKAKKKRKKKKKDGHELQEGSETHENGSGIDARNNAPICSETNKNHYMEGLGLEVAHGVTEMIKKKANKKKKRQEEMKRLKNKHVNVSGTGSNPLHKVMKRKLPDTHDADNLTQEPCDESQAEKRPRIDIKREPALIEKNAGERNKRKRKKKKKKPQKIEPVVFVDVQEQHVATQIEIIQTDMNSNSSNYVEIDDPDPVDDRDPLDGDFFPTGDEVADDDISVFMDEEEKAIKELQRRNEDALAMLRSTNNICKRLKGIVPQACPNLPSKPTTKDEKDSMLNNNFEWPDISKSQFPILHKVMDWIFTKESFVVPGKYILKMAEN